MSEEIKDPTARDVTNLLWRTVHGILDGSITPNQAKAVNAQTRTMLDYAKAQLEANTLREKAVPEHITLLANPRP